MSIEVNRETKTSMKAKGLSIVNGDIVDDSGEVINLGEVLGRAFGDSMFDLSAVKSIKEAVDIEPDEEVDIEDLQ